MALTAIVVMGAFVIYRTVAPPPQVASLDGLMAPSDAIGGPFALIDTNGKPVTDADLKGKPSALFFGYTYCPDVCPTTLVEAGGWLKALGPDADKLRIAFVSVDPERDTPEQMKLYLSSFDDRILGLTGTRAAVDQAIKAYRVYARKTPHDDTYLMDHTASVYLMDKDGKFVGIVNYGEPADRAVAKLKRLVGAS
jgi:protein SCO1/2